MSGSYYLFKDIYLNNQSLPGYFPSIATICCVCLSNIAKLYDHLFLNGKVIQWTIYSLRGYFEIEAKLIRHSVSVLLTLSGNVAYLF